MTEEVESAGFWVLSEDVIDDSFGCCEMVVYYCRYCLFQSIVKAAMLHKGKSVE